MIDLIQLHLKFQLLYRQLLTKLRNGHIHQARVCHHFLRMFLLPLQRRSTSQLFPLLFESVLLKLFLLNYWVPYEFCRHFVESNGGKARFSTRSVTKCLHDLFFRRGYGFGTFVEIVGGFNEFWDFVELGGTGGEGGGMVGGRDIGFGLVEFGLAINIWQSSCYLFELMLLWQLGKSCPYHRPLHLNHHYCRGLTTTPALLWDFPRLAYLLGPCKGCVFVCRGFWLTDAPLDVVRVVEVNLDARGSINAARKGFAFTGQSLRLKFFAGGHVKLDLLLGFLSLSLFIGLFLRKSCGWFFQFLCFLFHY